MRPDSHAQLLVTAACVLFRYCFFLFYVSLNMSLIPSIFVLSPFCLCMMEISSTSHVFSFRMTTGWIFHISLCVRIQSINLTIPSFSWPHVRTYVYRLYLTDSSATCKAKAQQDEPGCTVTQLCYIYIFVIGFKLFLFEKKSERG